MRTITKPGRLVGMALALAALATTVPAAAGHNLQTARVSFADLDLTRQPGLDSLDARLRSAVRQVCARVTALGGAAEMRELHRCRRDSWDRIEPQRQIAIAIANGRSESLNLARSDGNEIRINGTF